MQSLAVVGLRTRPQPLAPLDVNVPAAPPPSLDTSTAAALSGSCRPTAHPPSSTKPSGPSRRPSMIRVQRQQQQQQQQQQGCSQHAAPGAALALGVAAARLTLNTDDGAGSRSCAVTAQDPPRLFSYRPGLPTSSLSSAVSPTSFDATSLSDSARAAGSPSAAPTPQHVEAAKVLPNGLRSPSAITDVGAAPPDDSETTNDDGEPETRGSCSDHPGRHRTAQQSATDGAAPLNAPFHVLQLLSPATTDLIAATSSSTCGEAGQRGGGGGGGSDVDGRQPQRRQQQQRRRRGLGDDGRDSRVGDVSWQHPASRSEDRCSRFADVEEEAGTSVDAPPSQLLAGPIALLDSCADGPRTSAELRGEAGLHHHLVAMVTCVRHMQGRQHELEQRVRGLQEQLHHQAQVLHATRAELDQARRQSDASVSVPAAAGPSSALVGAKALPHDVSVCEPHLMDIGAEIESSSGTYVQQLRRRTSAARLLSLDLAAAGVAATTTAVSPERRGRRPRARAGALTTASSIPVAGTSVVVAAAAAAGPVAVAHRAASAQQLKPGLQHGAARQRSRLVDVSGASSEGSGVGGGGRRAVGHAQGKRLPSAPPPLPHGCSSGGGSPTRQDMSAASCNVCRRNDSRQPPGAGGSTDVSGMSSVPAYRLMNGSVSPISSASLDLDDHEDDTDAGAMRRQLLYLTPTERSLADGARRADAGAVQASARASPSLVSITYRPSELARAEDKGGVGAASDDRAGRHPPPSAPSRPDACNTPPALPSDGVRLALPLQRRTLVRKAGASVAGRTSHSQRVVPLPMPSQALSPTAHAASSSLSATRVRQRPRRTSAAGSGDQEVALVGLALPTSAPSPAQAATSSTAAAAAAASTTPLRESAATRATATEHPTHARSCRVDDDTLMGSVDGEPGKSSRRRGASRARRHATSVLLPAEAPDRRVGVPQLQLQLTLRPGRRSPHP